MKRIALVICTIGTTLAFAARNAPVPEAAAEPKAASAPASVPAGGDKSKPPASKPKPLDINAASVAELRALDPELTEARARAVVDGRPYEDIGDLVGLNILPKVLVDRLRGRLTVKAMAKQKS